jgi:hypothetical protein
MHMEARPISIAMLNIDPEELHTSLYPAAKDGMQSTKLRLILSKEQ